jgi:8-oxo-dGTP pyrophosphatase MutT (NUDIX family)
MKKLKHITTICRELYEETGYTTTMNFIADEIEKGNPAYKDVEYKECYPCESETPHSHNECLICGTNYNS